jgi:hypothetical protein
MVLRVFWKHIRSTNVGPRVERKRWLLADGLACVLERGSVAVFSGIILGRDD